MPEGLSAAEVGKEIAEHRHATEHREAADNGQSADNGEAGQAAAGHDTSRPGPRADRRMTIIEAVLLAVVAILAAYSGFAAAKWGTASSLDLAKASAARTQANRYSYEASDNKTYDSVSFNAWFTAYLAGNQTAMRVAENRFRAPFVIAFEAWLATKPFTNPQAPPGPTFMPEYQQPELVLANRYDQQADAFYAAGETAGTNSDNYVRTTVFLATVLFLVGISGHFRVRAARTGLVAVGGVILVFSGVLLILAPRPPV